MSAVLEIDDAHVRFGGVHALDGVSMRLEPGKLYGIVGPNGSGKTTLVNAITRVGPLTSGTISFGGTDIKSVAPHTLSHAGLARTFQSIRLVPTLTVRENIMLGADRAASQDVHKRRGWTLRRTSTAGLEADAAIERLDLRHVVHEYPHNLPYGTQRRIEIARALAGSPKLLLLDEPVAGMNRTERQEIGAVIASLREDGLTQLLIEHDLRLMLELCDHLFVFNFGRCVADGEPRATAALPVVQEAYLGKRHALS
jgi:branched-chain amino acid transport system ATP-binding protein